MGNASIRNLAGPAIASLRYWCNERRKPDLRCGCSTELDVLVGTRQVRKKKKVNKETARKEKKKKTKNGNRIVTNANWGLVQRKRKQQKKGENKKSQGGNRQKKKRKKRASDSVCRAAAWENFSSAKQPRYTAIKTHPLTHYQPYNNTKNKNNNNR